MLKNFFLVAIRNFVRQRLSTLINIFGLAIGLCCSMFIGMYAIDEFGYDRFHENADRIYRFNNRLGAYNELIPLGPYLLDSHIRGNVPGMEDITRIRPGDVMHLWMTDKEQIHVGEDIMLVDTNFFSFFSFPLIEGQAHQVLEDPGSMVISRSAAKKLFGDNDPVGHTLYLLGEHPVHITGVMEDFPRQSHFSASYIINHEISRRFLPDFIFNHWGSFGYYYYVLLEQDAEPGQVTETINMIFQEAAETMSAETVFGLQPLLDIRLRSERIAWDISTHGNYSLLMGLIAIAVIILLIASVNYVNLYTAQSAGRKKEVGVRKVMGATHRQIFWQSMVESLVTVLVSFLVAMVLVEILTPLVQQLSGKPLHITMLFSRHALLWLMLVLTVVTFLAGFYPAFVLGRFQPASILRGGQAGLGVTGRHGQFINLRVRQALIVFQFFCTTALIIISLSVNRQLNYMLSADPGYTSGDLILVHNPQIEGQADRFYRLKNEMEQFHAIEVVSAGMSIPTERVGNFTNLMIAGEDNEIRCGHINVHEGYFQAIGARLLAGRFFDSGYGTEQENLVISRSAATALGYQQPEDIIGKEALTPFSENNFRIIGVIEDIHYYSLHEIVIPLMFTTGDYQPSYGNILVRSGRGQLQQAIKDAESVWDREHLDYPFDFTIIEEKGKALYIREEQTRQLLHAFMVIAIIISLLGLFALASYVMVSRTREIAVRKVFGAGNKQILTMFANEFSLLIMISALLAWPAAWLVTTHWLDNFAYRLDIHYGYFFLATAISLVASWITISYHSFRAAKTNAANALKYE